MNKKIIFGTTMLITSLVGCTLPSTTQAQENSMRVQAVKDGVVNSLGNMVARESYETAKLNIRTDPSKAEQYLKEFAMKRDILTGVLLDNEMANTLKAVGVDAKLFSEQGILNYFGERISEDSKKFWTAWDAAKNVYKSPIKKDNSSVNIENSSK